MSKINDYNEKCLDEIYTELDAQEEERQMQYDKMTDALAQIKEVLESDRSDWGKTLIITQIMRQLNG